MRQAAIPATLGPGRIMRVPPMTLPAAAGVPRAGPSGCSLRCSWRAPAHRSGRGCGPTRPTARRSRAHGPHHPRRHGALRHAGVRGGRRNGRPGRPRPRVRRGGRWAPRDPADAVRTRLDHEVLHRAGGDAARRRGQAAARRPRAALRARAPARRPGRRPHHRASGPAADDRAAGDRRRADREERRGRVGDRGLARAARHQAGGGAGHARSSTPTATTSSPGSSSSGPPASRTPNTSGATSSPRWACTTAT